MSMIEKECVIDMFDDYVFYDLAYMREHHMCSASDILDAYASTSSDDDVDWEYIKNLKKDMKKG